MDCRQLKFSAHALQQLFLRNISTDDVEEVVRNGVTVVEYPDDIPYPSCLLLGINANRPIHVVAARNAEGTCIIVTAYEPSLELWENDFRTRRSII